MKIKNYNEFASQDILYIFDFDDTLVDSPSFEEQAIQYLSENLTIKDLLLKSIQKIDVSLYDLKWQDGKIYVDDPNQVLNPYGNWVRKGKRVYLFAPDIYSIIDISLPKKSLELKSLYDRVENKCIVTARSIAIKDKIVNKLQELGFEEPKYGLHMAPINEKNLGTWKGHKIVEIILETGFNKAIFYDDNSKYIKRATKVVKDKLPNLEFTTVKV